MPEFAVFKQGEAFVIQQSGSVFKTPAGNDYKLPTEKLATAIASEWNAQDLRKLQPEKMPLTKLAATVLDILEHKRSKIIVQMTAYAGADLLCHWAARPVDLVERQCQAWQPYLDWIQNQMGVSLKTCSGIMPLVQDKETLFAFQRYVENYDNFHLIALQTATEATGSLVLGIALLEQYKTPEEIFSASEVESHFQAEKWGEDPVTLARNNSIKNDLKSCSIWLNLLRVP